MIARMPVRVRIPAHPDAAALDALEAAVAAGAADALRVLQERHGVHATKFVPSVPGDGGPVVDAVLRGLARHGRVVDGQVPDGRPVDGPAPADAVLAEADPDGRLRERRRPLRTSRDTAGYLLPFYDGPRTGEVPATGPVATDFPTRAEVHEMLRRRLRGSETHPGYYGGVRIGGGVTVRLIWYDGASGVESFWDGTTTMLEQRDDTATTVSQRPRTAAWGEGDRVEMRAVGPVTRALIEELVDAAQERTRQRLRATGGLTDALEAELQRRRAPLIASFEARVAGHVVVHVGSAEFLAPAAFGSKTVHVLVGRTDVPDGEGSGLGGGGDGTGDGGAGGEGGGTGRGGAGGPTESGDGTGGRSGGPLGSDGSGTSRWPRRTAVAQEATCSSYEDEKSLQEIAALGEGGAAAAEMLRQEIDEIARELEIDPCHYAGFFTLKACRTIGAIARSIGLAARDAPGRTRVQVRPNGGGNNGVIDVTPEITPGLVYLHRLAALVPRVKRLVHTVYQAYDAIGEHGAVEHTHGWSVSFLNDTGDALDGSCALMFTEVCRVLLMQQLESTRETLAHRSGAGLPDTVRHFESALGILGERIVAAELGQRALRRAAQLGETGPAREVLRTPVPVDVDYYDLDAPGAGRHSYVLPPITDEEQLALVDGAEVRRTGSGLRLAWRDREWTGEDLDEHKQRQRAFLNQIDPLYLQVENLTAVYARVRRDGGAQPYLTDLLGRLMTANANIAREVRDEDDGGWFAVDTSRYVEAEGGYTELGTRYALHGIHGLADAELRPHVGGATWNYNNGVDLAIGRRARRDIAERILETTGMILLAIVCAPLGFVAAGAIVGLAGIGLAARDLMRAADREELYRSLENPETVLSWQEVQLEWLMATIGAAFSVLDAVAVGRAIRAGLGPMRSALRSGAREVLREQYQLVMRNLAGQAVERAIREASSQVVVELLMDRLLPVVLEPVIDTVAAGIAIEHGDGVLADPAAAAAALTSAAGADDPTTEGGDVR